jgi:diguanylate cyclase (GGDEF)-like protein
MFLLLSRRFRNVALLVLVLTALATGTWTIEKRAIEHLLYRDAVSTGLHWASYLAESVDDLVEIAQGEKPSPASMIFFEQAQKAGNVFRYKIFDKEGRLRLVSDELTAVGTDAQNLGQHNAAAAQAIAAGQPLVVAKEGQPPARPYYFAEAYVPVVVDGRMIAIVEAYVNQTDKRDTFRATFTITAILLSLLMVCAFCVPAVAWHLRTKQKLRAEDRVYFLAHHDAMTGLPNRNRLIEKLQESLLEAPSNAKRLALHYIDIDHFKNVNDTLGHDAGDSLIKATADRLRAISGSNNVVARLGGDEFVLVHQNLHEVDEVEMARRILETMAKPFNLNGHAVIVTASVGVGLAPQDGDTAGVLLKSADLAMYRAKGDGRNCIRFFVAGMDAELQARLTLEHAIREAAVNDAFELHFQPVVDLPGERLAGFEALLRLQSVDGSYVPPATFVPIAEEMGLISKIGTRVIHEACRIAATWPDHLTVAVNLSPAQFSGGICDTVAAALAETGLQPNRLELEITESLLLQDTGAVIMELRRLKALSVSIVMDDFGTGYSSLSYLWRFPFDKIKIDRSFMLAFDTSDKNVETIVRTIVGLGRSLGMRVTAEGVENARQIEFVRNTKCDQAQGYYFGEALPAAEIPTKIFSDFHRRLTGPLATSQAESKLRLVKGGLHQED